MEDIGGKCLKLFKQEAIFIKGELGPNTVRNLFFPVLFVVVYIVLLFNSQNC